MFSVTESWKLNVPSDFFSPHSDRVGEGPQFPLLSSLPEFQSQSLWARRQIRQRVNSTSSLAKLRKSSATWTSCRSPGWPKSARWTSSWSSAPLPIIDHLQNYFIRKELYIFWMTTSQACFTKSKQGINTVDCRRICGYLHLDSEDDNPYEWFRKQPSMEIARFTAICETPTANNCSKSTIQ